MKMSDGKFRSRKNIIRDNAEVSAPAAGSAGPGEPHFLGGSAADQTARKARAAGIQHAREAALNSPEIRIAKVNSVRAEIAEGRFQIDHEAVAEKILQDIISQSQFHK